MPIITEITDFGLENDNVKSSTSAPGASNNVKQWMHLNTILNCTTTTCKTYKMVQKHLLRQRKIDRNDIILIPSDYHVGSYSDAILTIICTFCEICNSCLKLLDHLSCTRRYCDCNSYKDICKQQVHLRHTVEKSSSDKNCFNKYNIHCSDITKEKLKSLRKYHEGAIKVMQGVIDSSQVDNLADESTTSENADDNIKNPSVEPSSSKPNTDSILNIKPNTTFKSNDNSAGGEAINSCSDEIDGTINSSESDITPYQAQSSQTSDGSYLRPFIFSDESYIGSSDENSDSDEHHFINSNSQNFRRLKRSPTSADFYCSYWSPSASLYKSVVSDSDFLDDPSSDSDVDYESHKQLEDNMDMFAHSHKFRSIENQDAGSEDQEGSVSLTDSSNASFAFKATRHFLRGSHGDSEVVDDMMNSTACTTGFHNRFSDYRHQTSSPSSNISNKYMKKNFISDSIFSDESSIDDESDISSEGDAAEFFDSFDQTSFRYQKKRRHKSINLSVFSDESQIEYSDDDFDDGEIQFGAVIRNSPLVRSTNGVVIVDVTDQDKSEVDKLLQGTTSIEQCSSTQSGFKTSKTISAASSSQGIKFHAADTTSANGPENASSSTAFDSSKPENINHTLSQLHEVSQSSDVHKPKRKRFRNKRLHTVKKLQQNSSYQKAKRCKRNKKKMNNNVQDGMEGPSSSSGYAFQNVCNTANNGPRSKTSAIGDINYSYLRNVLALQNAQVGSSGNFERRKFQSKKSSTHSNNKEKMKLYDCTSWIESSNYDQLCHSHES